MLTSLFETQFLRIGRDVLSDHDMLGLYAENLVFNAFRKWTEVIQIDYFRENQREVDFIVHVKPSQYWPVEVKSRNSVDLTCAPLSYFIEKHLCFKPRIVTRNREDWGTPPDKMTILMGSVQFLLVFD